MKDQHQAVPILWKEDAKFEILNIRQIRVDQVLSPWPFEPEKCPKKNYRQHFQLDWQITPLNATPVQKLCMVQARKPICHIFMNIPFKTFQP